MVATVSPSRTRRLRTFGVGERYGHLTPAHKAEAVERIAQDIPLHLSLHRRKGLSQPTPNYMIVSDAPAAQLDRAAVS